jgi:hypothetical protein
MKIKLGNSLWDIKVWEGGNKGKISSVNRYRDDGLSEQG